VRFDDLFFGEVGGDTNLLRNPGFEPTEPGELDGVYIDSSEMAATTPNFRREHWRYSATPLTFTRDGSVCQLTIFNAVEFARSLAEPLHERGLMLFANSTPSRFPWLAAWLDVMGTETNWSPGEDYRPMPDMALNYRRAICYQRPYLTLLNTVYDDFAPEWVELYFKRTIAYGVFPSFFSHNAATERYWDRPNLCNRDRELFRKYIPVCAALSRAGWEPVTYAHSSDPLVYVERFGRGPLGASGEGGELFLTLFNDSLEARRASITLDAAALSLERLVVTAVLADAPVEAVVDDAFAVELGPEDLVVVRVAEGP